MDRVIKTIVNGTVQDLHILEALRVRAQDLYPEVVERYVAALRGGGALPPVRVLRCGARLLLVDGRHRIAAWTQMQMAVQVDQLADVADMGEALAVALRANTQHGEPRRLGDVSRCVELALEGWPELSAREIARRVGCSHTLVNRVREGQAAPQVETVSTPAPMCREESLGADPCDVEEVVAAQPLDGRYAAGPEVDPQWIISQPYQTAYTLELPVLQEEDTREFRLAVGVDYGAEPSQPTVMQVGPDGRLVLPEAAQVYDMDAAQAVLQDQEGRGRRRGQDPLERWYTPPDLAAVCWGWLLGSGLVTEVGGHYLEPCVGGGAWRTGLWAAAAQRNEKWRAGVVWTCCDMDAAAPGLKGAYWPIVGDVTAYEFGDARFQVAISNPPNSRALEVIQACLAVGRPGGVVAMLMPASWMAARRRREWLKLNPPRVVALAPWRPSFEGPAAEMQGTGGGSPTQDYALHVWVVGDPPGVEWRTTWIEDGGQEEGVGDGQD